MKKLASTCVVLLWLGCSSGGAADGGGGGSGANIDPARSTVTLDPPGPLLADGSAQGKVNVTVLDTNGKPLSHVPVAVSLSGDGGQATTPSPTDDKGATTSLYFSLVAETKTITVTAGNPPVTLATQPKITFFAGPPLGVHIDVGPPAMVKAGETITPPVHVVLLDQNGNFAPTVPCGVQLRLVRSNNGILAGGSEQMSVDGGVTFDMLSIDQVQQGYALRAEVLSGPAMGAAEESAQFDVVVGDVSALTSTFLAMPVNVTADGTATSTLTLTLLDLGLNPVAGQAVTLSVSGSGGHLAATSGMSDAQGTFSTTVSSTVAEMKTITATIGSAQLTTQVNFTP